MSKALLGPRRLRWGKAGTGYGSKPAASLSENRGESAELWASFGAEVGRAANEASSVDNRSQFRCALPLQMCICSPRHTTQRWLR